MSGSNSSSEFRDYGRSRLCRLVGLLCDEAITRDEQAELEQLLLSDPAARDQFLEDLSVHAALEGEIAARGKVVQFVERARNGDAGWWQFEGAPTAPLTEPLPYGRTMRSLAVLAAAVLMAVTATLLWRSGWKAGDDHNRHQNLAAAAKTGDADKSPPIVASVSPKSDDCHWMFEDQNIFEIPNDSARSEIWAGETLRVVAGSLDVVFDSGVAVTLSAPAILEIVSPMRGRLIRGRATVNVCKGAEGFTINTPRTSVIDLGTVFGVEVDDFGRTDIVVFKGMVDVAFSQANEKSSNPAIGSQRLRMGEAVRVDERGTLSRIISINGNDFSVNSPAAPAVPAVSPVITSVRDNIERQETWKFYEIVPGGMREDAKAFVDRLHHEWNGVDAKGMPDYLIGGDYVKPFNNDKMMSNIEVRVTLDQPATLYLLWCNRVVPPDWLLENFENTGDEIGVDEGYHVFENGAVHDRDGPGVGPGVSVDSIHTVWRRVIPKPGTVRLGPTGATDLDDLNMYGIVAVPLKNQ